MATINLGAAANDGTGTTLRAAGAILNDTGLRKNNFAATTNPIVTNDASQSYEIGSEWLNTSLSRTFRCMSATVGAAVWERVLSDAAPADITEITAIIDTDRVLVERLDGSPASAPATAVVRADGTVRRVTTLTAAAYTALSPKVVDTLYVVIG